MTAPKQYTGEAVIPFSNRVCFEIKEKEAKGDEKVYQIFGLSDEDTGLIYEEILCLTGKAKKPVNKRNSVLQEEKEK